MPIKLRHRSFYRTSGAWTWGIGHGAGRKAEKQPCYHLCPVGDGEIQEGGIWEAAMAASKYKADNLIAILDNNGCNWTVPWKEIMPMGDIGSKFASFGWNVIHCDGHDIKSFSEAVDEAKECKDKPTVIIAKPLRVKGYLSWRAKTYGMECLSAMRIIYKQKLNSEVWSNGY